MPNYRQARGVGQNAVGDDVSGSGNGTASFTATVRFVDVYNAGAGVLTITDGNLTRRVHPGPRLCEFEAASTDFTVTADGDWTCTPMA